MDNVDSPHPFGEEEITVACHVKLAGVEVDECVDLLRREKQVVRVPAVPAVDLWVCSLRDEPVHLKPTPLGKPYFVNSYHKLVQHLLTLSFPLLTRRFGHSK